MKNSLRKMMSASAIVFVLLAANIAFAQTAKRIEFAKAASWATVKGAGNQSYFFRVGGERTIKIRLVSKSKSASFDLLDAEGSDLSEGSDGRSLEMTTTGTGDYRIDVHAGKNAAFTLAIMIKP